MHFVDLAADHLAIGSTLVADAPVDEVVLHVAIMDSHWPQEVRSQVIVNLLAALASAMGLEALASGWWVNFRVIDEGSWGSSGRVLSVHDLLASGVFTDEKGAAIRATTPRFEG